MRNKNFVGLRQWRRDTRTPRGAAGRVEARKWVLRITPGSLRQVEAVKAVLDVLVEGLGLGA